MRTHPLSVSLFYKFLAVHKGTARVGDWPWVIYDGTIPVAPPKLLWAQNRNSDTIRHYNMKAAEQRSTAQLGTQALSFGFRSPLRKGDVGPTALILYSPLPVYCRQSRDRLYNDVWYRSLDGKFPSGMCLSAWHDRVVCRSCSHEFRISYLAANGTSIASWLATRLLRTTVSSRLRG